MFLSTSRSFFIVEFGDKTQISKCLHAAHLYNIPLVTLGMIAANAPAVFALIALDVIVKSCIEPADNGRRMHAQPQMPAHACRAPSGGCGLRPPSAGRARPYAAVQMNWFPLPFSLG